MPCEGVQLLGLDSMKRISRRILIWRDTRTEMATPGLPMVDTRYGSLADRLSVFSCS